MDRKILATAALGIVLGAAPGCVIVTEDPDPTGTLTVNWTIDGTTHPLACDAHRVSYAQIVISAPDGEVEASLSPPCTAFATSVGLYAGWHRMAMTMMDAYGRPVSTTVTASVDVWRNRTATLWAEFPATSFYQ